MIRGLNKKHFAAGFALGFLFALIIAGIAVRAVKQGRRNPGQYKARIMNKMQKELRLEADQAAGISAILDARFADMKTVRETTRAEHERIHTTARDEIREILNSEQAEKFDAFNKKMDARRARWGKRKPK